MQKSVASLLATQISDGGPLAAASEEAPVPRPDPTTHPREGARGMAATAARVERRRRHSAAGPG